ncbi:hypothetical protein CBR_g36986 [Chara braunii]|uniref:Uncharacterized protein n=1 Tax=Chara braunii TaxID=69332 RepID=A0A388JZJ9_CHABU|nr:hypothetical protein CBR_g36986 [Chara braunii]|eukprot:GBG63218.1 hypothetical protein CBR_g36986 [Chara braunii]
MREGIQKGHCRINDETKKELIIGEPGFLTRQEEDLVKELIREKHGAYAFDDDQRGRLDGDKIEMFRIHTVPHEPWNVRGAKYPNLEDRRRVVEYLDGKIRTDVAGYSSGPYASPWFCFVKPNGVLRWVQDLQRLNEVTVRDARGLPNADQLSEVCAGMYKRRIEGVVAGCTRWRVCKVRLWRDMGKFPRDDVEDDLRFDGTNLEDFVESLQLAAKRGEWSEEEKRKQSIARSDKDEKEEVREIVEGSRTWKRITAELWIAYTQARQDQIRKERLQNKGLWIGREVTDPQGKEEENEKEDNVPLKKLKNKAMVSPKSSSKES